MGGGRGFVDDYRAGSTLPSRFLKLVGPAAIIGHGLAFEEVILAGIAGIVDQHNNGFALDIQTFVIVPAIFGSDHTIANKNKFGVGPACFVPILSLGPEDGVFLEGQG